MNKTWPKVKLGEVLKPTNRQTALNSSQEYKLLGVRLDGGGPFLREQKLGSQLSANTLYQVKNGDFIYSRLFAWRGAFGVICNALDSCFVSNEFPTFTAQKEQLNANFLKYWFRLPHILKKVEADCTGSTPLTRNRYKENFFLNLQIPLPPLEEQQRIVAKIERLSGKIEEARELRFKSVQESKSIILSKRNKLFTKISKEIKSRFLSSVSDSRLGKMLSQNQAQDNDGTPYVRNANVQWGYLDLSDIYRMHVTEEEKEKFSLQSGDILICEGGDIGKAVVYPIDIQTYLTQGSLRDWHTESWEA